jgi:tripartite-type tricarboxylate transporter receptor subunit TctC
MNHLSRAGAALIGAAIAAAPLTAAADPIADFYTGKKVPVIIGAGPAGGYALYARLAVEFMAKHVPGKPSFVMQSMPGGGGTKAANFAYNVAPKDGSALIIIVQTVATDTAAKGPGVKFDARKFNYIGRFTDNTPVGVGWVKAGVTSLDVLRSRQVIAGGTGPSSPTDIGPNLLNRYAGTKFKVVSGYKGAGAMALAMERGETEFMVGSWAAFKTRRKHMLDKGQIKVLFQLAPARIADLPDVPAAPELGSTPRAKAVMTFIASSAEVGRSVAGPPGMPKARVDALLTAFNATVKDPAFLAYTKKRGIDVNPVDGAALKAIIDKTMETPADVVAEASSILLAGKKKKK